jgi:hypothetical protein
VKQTGKMPSYSWVNMGRLYGETTWKSAILCVRVLVSFDVCPSGESLHIHFYCPVYDFEPIAPLISYALVDVMRCSAAEHPVLVTEPAWNTTANRERMAEMMFEEFQVPAFYIANTGVLNA